MNANIQFNAEACSSFFFRPNSKTIDQGIQDRIFEIAPFQHEEILFEKDRTLKDVIYNKFRKATFHINDLLPVSSSWLSFSLMGYSSFFYQALSQYCITATTLNTENLQTYFYCKVELNQDAKEDENYNEAINFLVVMNIDLQEPYLIYETVFNHIKKNYSKVISIQIYRSFATNVKSITLNKIESEYDFFSINKQKSYSHNVNTILTYTDNIIHSEPNISFSALQSFLIHQQIRFLIFEKLRPLSNFLYFKQNQLLKRGKLLSNKGALFFNLVLPKHSNISLSEIQNFLATSGLMLHSDNLNSHLNFSDLTSDLDIIPKKQNLIQDIACLKSNICLKTESVIYPILLRLFSNDLNETLKKIDDLFLDQESINDVERKELISDLLELAFFSLKK